MHQPLIKRQLVWPVSIRVTHGIIALSVTGLLITGWIQHYLPDWYDIAFDYHYIFAYFLTFSVVYRLYLLFSSRNNAASWREFIPGSLAKQNLFAMFRFYLSFARTPLPRWYAHNPFWSPLYLLITIILILQIATGFLMTNHIPFSPVDLNFLHHSLSLFIFWFSVLHVLAVVLHDIKGTGSDISAMLNGHRIFIIEQPQAPLSTSTSQKVTFPPVYTPTDKKPDENP